MQYQRAPVLHVSLTHTNVHKHMHADKHADPHCPFEVGTCAVNSWALFMLILILISGVNEPASAQANETVPQRGVISGGAGVCGIDDSVHIRLRRLRS